jgi:hypothetical protein
MDWDDIAQELFMEIRNAESTALFTKDSAMDLAIVVVNGVRKMELENRTDPADLREARESLGNLLGYMAGEREALGIEVFTESTVAGGLHNARLSLCPGFWPFC